MFVTIEGTVERFDSSYHDLVEEVRVMVEEGETTLETGKSPKPATLIGRVFCRAQKASRRAQQTK